MSKFDYQQTVRKKRSVLAVKEGWSLRRDFLK